MIPNEKTCYKIWDQYHLPMDKRRHVQLVKDVAVYLSEQLVHRDKTININAELLIAGCLLHDIDKVIPRLRGEVHPETGVRVLLLEGYQEIAELIRFHSVQYIEFPETAPKTWEQKLLFLSDKMVKQEIITVDQRFALWLAEKAIPDEQKQMLQRVYPRVKELEAEIFGLVGILPRDMAQLIAITKEAV